MALLKSGAVLFATSATYRWQVGSLNMAVPSGESFTCELYVVCYASTELEAVIIIIFIYSTLRAPFRGFA